MSIPPNPDPSSTTPDPALSYEGSPQTEDAYAEGGDAQKPASATGSGSDGNGRMASEAPDEASNDELLDETDAGDDNVSEAPDTDSSNSPVDSASAGSSPENSEDDDTTATSRETGDPKSMKVGAVPG